MEKQTMKVKHLRELLQINPDHLVLYGEVQGVGSRSMMLKLDTEAVINTFYDFSTMVDDEEITLERGLWDYPKYSWCISGDI